MQVFVVQHGAFPLSVFFEYSANYYLFVTNSGDPHNPDTLIRMGNQMHIQIHADDFDLTEGLRDHVAKRLAYAMNHGRDIVSRIVVRLSDVNGPRGGVDKRCGIEVRLKGSPTIAIDDTEADLYVAIDRAAERTGRTLDRRIARRHHLATRHAHPEQSIPDPEDPS
jgi:ribosomal subunit interface protein